MRIGTAIAIPTRRGSHWNPLAVSGSTALLWLRGDLGITIATGVSTWADQSGQSNDLTQATGGNQPSFESAGFGGQPSVLFDGAAHWMGRAAGTLCTHLSGEDKPWTMVAALQCVTVTNNDVWHAWDESGGGNSRNFFFETAPTSFSHNIVDDASGVFGTGFPAGAITTNRAIYSIVYSGTGTEMFRDGVSQGAISVNAGVCTFNLFTLCAQRPAGGAASSFCNNRIAETVVYNTALSAANRGLVETYMRGRYGI